MFINYKLFILGHEDSDVGRKGENVVHEAQG
jgi:hypothetical protein